MADEIVKNKQLEDLNIYGCIRSSGGLFEDKMFAMVLEIVDQQLFEKIFGDEGNKNITKVEPKMYKIVNTMKDDEYDRILPLYQKIERLLSTFTYKPGFRFKVTFTLMPAVIKIIMKAHVPFRDFPEQSVDLDFVMTLDEITVASFFNNFADKRGIKNFWMWLREGILEFEKHEMDEFFRVDGELIFDPHDQKKRRA